MANPFPDLSDDTFSYTVAERLPVEVLVFEVAPDHVDEFLAVDHDVWTLGEASILGDDEPIPFRSQEVWLDEAHPGRVTLVFVWESLAAWMRVGTEANMERLQSEFDARFPHEVKLVAAPHEDSAHGIHRVSRFERVD